MFILYRTYILLEMRCIGRPHFKSVYMAFRPFLYVALNGYENLIELGLFPLEKLPARPGQSVQNGVNVPVRSRLQTHTPVSILLQSECNEM